MSGASVVEVGEGGGGNVVVWVERGEGEAEGIIRCNWTLPPCNQVFRAHSEFSLFREHLTVHHFKQQTDAGGLICRVANCDLFADSEEYLQRHILFHVYHAQLQLKGLLLLSSHPPLANVQHCYSHGTAASVNYAGKPFQCLWNGCQRDFDEVSIFSEHVICHGKDLEAENRENGKYCCHWEDCLYGALSRRTVVAHLYAHTGVKKIACPFCGAAFCDNKTKLTDHLLRKAGDETSRLKCFLCQKTFTTERLLREHSRRHIKHYKCPFCDMSLETPSDVRRHIENRHISERSHSCSVCKKSFVAPTDLERHRLTHVAKDYEMNVCDVCNKGYRTKQWLDNHKRRHKVAKPYICHVCPATFGVGSLLGQHLRRVHKIAVPSGHSRFTYKKCSDGLFRLQTERYESQRLVGVAPNAQDILPRLLQIPVASVLASTSAVAGESVSLGVNQSINGEGGSRTHGNEQHELVVHPTLQRIAQRSAEMQSVVDGPAILDLSTSSTLGGQHQQHSLFPSNIPSSQFLQPMMADGVNPSFIVLQGDGTVPLYMNSTQVPGTHRLVPLVPATTASS